MHLRSDDVAKRRVDTGAVTSASLATRSNLSDRKSGLLYGQMLPLAYCLRATGCLFIEGFNVRTDAQNLRIRWRSWYSLYAVLWHLIVWGAYVVIRWTNLRVTISHFSLRGAYIPISVYTAVAINCVTVIQVVVNTVTMFAAGGKLLALLKTAECYDRRIGVTRRDCPSNGSHWVQFTLSYGFAIPLGAIFSYVSSPNNYATYMKQGKTGLWVGLSIADILSLCVLCMWGNGNRLMFKTLSHIFWMYLRRIRSNIQRALSDDPTPVRTLEDNRLFLCEFYDLLEQTNDVLKYSIVAFYPCTMLVLTVLIYSSIEFKQEPWQMFYTLSYGLYTVIDICHSSYVVHVMQCEAVSVRRTLESARYLGRPQDLVIQAQLLLQTLDLSAITFSGCGFFNIQMSLVVTVIGTVITYSVILIQTSQGLQCASNGMPTILSALTNDTS